MGDLSSARTRTAEQYIWRAGSQGLDGRSPWACKPSRWANGQYRPPALTEPTNREGQRSGFHSLLLRQGAMDMMDQWFGGFRPGSAWRQLCPRHARTPGDSAAPRRGGQEPGPCLTWMGGSSGFPSTAHWNRTRASPLHAKTVCCALIGRNPSKCTTCSAFV